MPCLFLHRSAFSVDLRIILIYRNYGKEVVYLYIVSLLAVSIPPLVHLEASLHPT